MMKLEPKVTKSTTALAAAAAAAAASSTGAMAADLAIKAPAVPAVPTWQGLYVGGSIGASWLSSVQDDGATYYPTGAYYGSSSSSGQRQTANAPGFIGGLDIGYNWQDRNFVYGVEADMSWLGGSKASSTEHNAYYTVTKSANVQGLATFRGRVGLDFNGTMPYITAGFAMGEIKNSVALTGYGMQSKTSWQPGVVVGGGLEHNFMNHWTLKGEVLWVGLKDTTMLTYGPSYTAGGTTQFSNSMVIGRVGLNYHF